jgi:hypothetical protein
MKGFKKMKLRILLRKILRKKDVVAPTINELGKQLVDALENKMIVHEQSKEDAISLFKNTIVKLERENVEINNTIQMIDDNVNTFTNLKSKFTEKAEHNVKLCGRMQDFIS